MQTEGFKRSAISRLIGSKAWSTSFSRKAFGEVHERRKSKK
jgi:hypothetical protein